MVYFTFETITVKTVPLKPLRSVIVRQKSFILLKKLWTAGLQAKDMSNCVRFNG